MRLTSLCSNLLTLIHVSFHRQSDTLMRDVLSPNLAESCPNYAAEYTKAVYKICRLQ